MSISKDSVTSLMEIYLGEQVIFYMKDMKINGMTEDGNQVDLSGAVDGYVVDIDDSFFYLGNPEGNIDKTIAHDAIAIIEISPDEEGGDSGDMLKDMDMPSDEEIH